jgi:hypothetical protein
MTPDPAPAAPAQRAVVSTQPAARLNSTQSLSCTLNHFTVRFAVGPPQ